MINITIVIIIAAISTSPVHVKLAALPLCEVVPSRHIICIVVVVVIVVAVAIIIIIIIVVIIVAISTSPINVIVAMLA